MLVKAFEMMLWICSRFALLYKVQMTCIIKAAAGS